MLTCRVLTLSLDRILTLVRDVKTTGSSVLQGLLGRGIAKIGGLSVDPYVNIKLGGFLAEG